MNRDELKSGWIKITKKYRKVWIAPTEICYCRADRCYSHLFLKTGKSYLVCEPLSKLEDQLPMYFFRCHRSYLINMMEVESLDIVKRIIYQKLYQVPFSQRKTTELLSEWPIRIKNKILLFLLI